MLHAPAVRICGCVALACVLVQPWASPAQTTGTLIGVVTDAATGSPLRDVTVIVTGLNLQGEQLATTRQDGTWRIDFLPPGPCVLHVVAAGYVGTERDDLTIGTDRTLKVATSLVPSTVTLDEQVVRVVARPGVDPTSAETGVVLPASFVAAVPLPSSSTLFLPGVRSFEASALAASGAQADALGVGFFGGVSSENRYLVDGFDVTDPGLGVNLSPLLVDFVQVVDVKTGNYAAEYGRGSGGVISAVTKSGSNELHGSIFSNLTPRWAFQPDGRFTGTDGQAFWSRDRNSAGAYDVDVGFEAGGPIIRDRLWLHAGFAPTLTRNVTERTLRANVLPDAAGACPTGASDGGDGLCRDASGAALQDVVPGATRRWSADTRTWDYTAKLTWLATPDHTLTLSAFGNPYTRETVRPNTAEYRRYRDEGETVFNTVASWTGRLFSRRVLLEALVGWMLDDYGGERRPASGFDSTRVPMKAWYGPGLGPLPLGLLESVPEECGAASERCLDAGYQTGGFATTDYSAQRLGARLSGSYLFTALGSHVAKLGVDLEHSRYRMTSVRAGAASYNMVVTPSGVSARARGQGYVSTDPSTGAQTALWLDSVSFEPALFTPAVYLQDQWQPHRTVTLNAGLRWESQSMSGGQRPRSVDLHVKNALAPRAQLIWDPAGRGRSKIAMGWGRFYETPALSLVDTSFNTNFQARFACPANTVVGGEPLNPRTECPMVQNWSGGGAYRSMDVYRPVAPGIGAAYVDQFVVAAEHDVWRDVTVGIEYQGRRLGNAIEDMAAVDGGVQVFYLANPGTSAPFHYVDADGKQWVLDGRTLEAVDPATGRRYTVPVPRPQRTYDGITFRVTKLSARGLFGLASYTLSQLRGDYSGRMQLDVEQYFNPAQSVDYEYAELVRNRRGLLPEDHTHVVRLYGGYRWLPTARLGVTVGAGVNARSGSPVNVRGVMARDDELGYGDLAFIVPRGRGGRTPWLTTLDLRAQAEYAFRPPWGLRVSVDAFNVLDARAAVTVDETYTWDQVLSISGQGCRGNPAGRTDPSVAVAQACPDLAYLKTVDGRPATVNRNWGRAKAYQEPLLLRFGVALTF